MSNAPLETPLATLVRVSGIRWPIETCFAEGGEERLIHPHRGRGVGHGFDASKPADKEHLQLLDGRVFEDFLPQVDMPLQRLKKPNLLKIVS